MSEPVHSPVRPCLSLSVLPEERVRRDMSRRRFNGRKRQQVCSHIVLSRYASEKTSRFILANTEQLHDKIKTMSERIHQLEDALRSTNSRLTSAEHPLLRQELLLIKKSPELFGIDQHLMVSDASTEQQHRSEEPPRTSPASSSKDGDEVSNRRRTPLLYYRFGH